MNVLVLYTRLPEELGRERVAEEFELTAAAEGVSKALGGAPVAGVRGEPGEILQVVGEARPDVVFNLCEAPLGRPDREPHAAALFEWLGVRFTGSGSQTLALCRRKDLTRAVLQAAGVPVPRAGGFPCIVKPVDEDGSAGIDGDSVCADPAARDRALARLAGPALVEEFLPGNEFVVTLWGGDGPEYHAIGEVFFEGDQRIFTYAAKWVYDSPDFENSWLDYQAEIPAHLREALLATARRAWHAVGARGYLRLDLRLDAEGVPRVLDVNPNPEVTPGRGGTFRAVTEAGWSWERFVKCQVDWA